MEQIINASIVLIIAIVSCVLGQLVPVLNNGLSKVSSITSSTLIKNVIKDFIVYAQEFISKDGDTKMTYVVNQVSDMCKKSNIKITDEQIKVLAEGVYNEVKDSVKKIEFNG